MGCATGAVKYAMFLFNTLWAILAILIILFAGLGWDAMPQYYAIGIIILGGVILLVSFFGCFGALRESTRMMWVYVVFLVLLLALNIAFMCVNTRDVFKKYALKGVDDLWNKEVLHPGSMDPMQITYSCCGRNGAEDYVKIGRLPPSSCCKDSNCINPLNLNIIGCFTKVEEAFADEATTTKYYEYGWLAFNLILIVLAVLLAVHFNKQSRRYNY